MSMSSVTKKKVRKKIQQLKQLVIKSKFVSFVMDGVEIPQYYNVVFVRITTTSTVLVRIKKLSNSQDFVRSVIRTKLVSLINKHT